MWVTMVKFISPLNNTKYYIIYTLTILVNLKSSCLRTLLPLQVGEQRISTRLFLQWLLLALKDAVFVWGEQGLKLTQF